MNIDDLLGKYKLLLKENNDLKKEVFQLKNELQMISNKEVILDSSSTNQSIKSLNSINKFSSSDEKIDLYKSLFKGREDVCAKKWKSKTGYSPYCKNDFITGICFKPKVKCIECKNSAFVKLGNDAIQSHLLGQTVLGLYPLTKNDTCYLLAIDFDKSTWKEDVKTLRDTSALLNIPIYAERSQSGNGCHLWLFFESEIKATIARKFAFKLLDLSMQKNSTLGFDSYDRLFPSQDLLQDDGFGNLIALPLQKVARNKGNTVFVDNDLNEIEDQWEYLSSIQKITKKSIDLFLEEKKSKTEYEDSLFDQEVSLNRNDFGIPLTIIKKTGLLINKNGISSKALYKLRKLASYINPEYYLKQRIRKSTFGTPRISVHYSETDQEILLPRGVEIELLNYLDKTIVEYTLIDSRIDKRIKKLNFQGQLNETQKLAFDNLNRFDNGVLSAPTGFGKTVIGAKLIASKNVSSLVLVHTKELAYQWIERLEQFIKYNDESIPLKVGFLGNSKNALTANIDVALIQSMIGKDKQVKPFIDQYSLIIIDECHHVSAHNFSQVLSTASAKYVYGLTATAFRKDGHNPIIFMECGPLRYTVNVKNEISKHKFEHYIVPRFSSLRLPLIKKEKDYSISELYSIICESKTRNNLIVEDIERAINNGRNPIVLTQWTQHIDILLDLLKEKDYEVIVLSGKLKTSVRKRVIERLKSLKETDKFVIIASGKLIGEGFDLALLDTLFLVMPISWKGTITQYIGRLHRNYAGKNEVEIYDYIDVNIPVFERMYQKRLSAYRKLDYKLKLSEKNNEVVDVIFNKENYFDKLLHDINSAQKYIIISSPLLQKHTINKYKDILIDKFKSGVKTIIYSKNIEIESKLKSTFNELLLNGVEINFVEGYLFNFVIIDGEIVWYGDISILSFTKYEGSLIRIVDRIVSQEIENTLRNGPDSL